MQGAAGIGSCALGCAGAVGRLEHYAVCPKVWLLLKQNRPHGLGIEDRYRSVQGFLLGGEGHGIEGQTGHGNRRLRSRPGRCANSSSRSKRRCHTTSAAARQGRRTRRQGPENLEGVESHTIGAFFLFMASWTLPCRIRQVHGVRLGLEEPIWAIQR